MYIGTLIALADDGAFYRLFIILIVSAIILTVSAYLGLLRLTLRIPTVSEWESICQFLPVIPLINQQFLHHQHMCNLRVYSPLCGLHGGMDHVVLEARVLLILSPFKAGHLKNLFGERCVHSVALKIYLSLHLYSFSPACHHHLEHVSLVIYF